MQHRIQIICGQYQCLFIYLALFMAATENRAQFCKMKNLLTDHCLVWENSIFVIYYYCEIMCLNRIHFKI